MQNLSHLILPGTIGFLVIGFIVLLVLYKKGQKKQKDLTGKYHQLKKALNQSKVTVNQLKTKYKNVIDMDQEVFKRKKLCVDLNKRIKELKDSFINKREVYMKLLNDIAIVEEDLENISYGLYKPHFNFDTSEKFKEKINESRSRQKDLIKEKKAVICHTAWEVAGSKKSGKKMTDHYMKLMLRAFNNECDSAVLKVKWNNAIKMEERILKSFDAVNKLGESHHIEVARDYLIQKLNELRLTHEFHEKLYEEKEEQKRIKNQMREEEKARREIEKAKQEAEREEERYEAALEKAKREMGEAHGEKAIKLESQILRLQEQLEEAHQNKERALSRAQMTRSGHVYVISNIGSFGEDVFKIGMTRRLEPLDRVKELGDASVPFEFDIHAMIYSEDAPDLEGKLHRTFSDYRVNLVNQRKEFFNVPISEIEKKVTEMHGDIEITKLAEARDYHETIAIRGQRENDNRMPEVEKIGYPEYI
jgi:hypothetical protein